MCRVSIISDNNTLVNDILSALPESIHCKAFSPAKIEFDQDFIEDFTSSDALIVEFAPTNHLSPLFFSHLNYNYPEVTIIAITPAEKLGAAQSWATLGVDEILLQPENDAQAQGLIERLLMHLSRHDHLRLIQERLRREMTRGQIIARSKPMREIIQQLPQFAACTSTILITGETGTGKELLARAIHYLGPRASEPFITIDCGALPEHLVENELFGHAPGAYTDARKPSQGLIQEGDGGTLFLDEIEALPFSLQAKFLRFLQERQYKPLGQTKYVSVNIRVLAATNVNLAEAVAKKNFREDLYYRLNVLPLSIPPLRARKADIPALSGAFLQRHHRLPQPPAQIPDEMLRRWMEYDWPGNVRELENKVQQWLAGSAIDKWPAASALFESGGTVIPLLAVARQEATLQFEREYLRNLIAHVHGNISAAARLAGTDRKHIRKLFRKHNLFPNQFC